MEHEKGTRAGASQPGDDEIPRVRASCKNKKIIGALGKREHSSNAMPGL